jgi:hypothetical protein
VSFLQPLDSTAMTFVPDLGAGTVDANGLTYYLSAIGALKVDQNYSLHFDYKKTTDRLSASVQTVQPTGPVGSTFVSILAKNLNLILGVLVILLVVALLVGIIFWRKDRKRSSGDSRKRHISTAKRGNLPGDVYCNQCGKRAQPGDVFCRTCGTRIRRE